jgi:hypothetical protein
MSHTIIYNSESQAIELKVSGRFTSHDVKEIISELLQVAKENNCYFILNDFREAIVNLSTMKIYELPQIISDIAASMGLKIHHFQRAAVVVRDYDEFKFFENVTFNQGQNLKLFQDIDEAKKWLSEKISSPKNRAG